MGWESTQLPTPRGGGGVFSSFTNGATRLGNRLVNGPAPPSTDPLEQDREQARAMQADIARRLSTADATTSSVPRAAPLVTASPTQVAPVQQVGQYGSNLQAQQAVAARINGTQQAQAAQVAPVATFSAPSMGSTAIGPIERARAAQLGPTAMANSASSVAAQLNLGAANQVRGQQMGAVGMLQDAAAGKAPSAAELMLRRAADRNAGLANAQAAQARGGAVGAARRAAARNVAMINQDTAGQAAVQRAAEQATARGQLVGALQGIRGDDVGLATTQAGFQQQAGLQNAQLGTNVNLANAGALNQANLTQGQFQQQVGLANSSAYNQMAQAQAQMDQRANEINTANALTAAQFGAQAQNQAGLANAGFQQQAGMANAAAFNQTNATNAGFQQQTGLANTQAANQMDATRAGLMQSAAQYNAGAVNDSARLQAQLAQQLSLANSGAANAYNQSDRDAALRIQQMDEARRMQLLQAALQAQQAQFGQTAAIYGANQAAAQAKAQYQGQALGGLGQILTLGL